LQGHVGHTAESASSVLPDHQHGLSNGILALGPGKFHRPPPKGRNIPRETFFHTKMESISGKPHIFRRCRQMVKAFAFPAS